MFCVPNDRFSRFLSVSNGVPRVVQPSVVVGSLVFTRCFMLLLSFSSAYAPYRKVRSRCTAGTSAGIGRSLPRFLGLCRPWSLLSKRTD